jgi:rhamnogalacturonyl hydrolase YesR
MAPPTWAKLYKATDDVKYLNYLDHQWWVTSDNLYDPAEHLFYRDATFITKRESNGQKMFWSRGEGWVMGGLARVLQIMPADYPDRGKFVTQFKDMATRIAGLQGPDGLWRAGMLDPDFYGEPENSGSAFFVYAMAWGVNEGILDRATFEPVIAKGWKGLLSHVHADGRLDCIQQTGSGPAHFKTSSSYVYGVGAFLLAGREVNRLAITLAMEHRTIATP